MQPRVTPLLAPKGNIALFAAAAALVSPKVAKAGHCDTPISVTPAQPTTTQAEAAPTSLALGAAVAFEFASFRTPAYEGTFAQLAPALGARVQNFNVSLTAPYYWLQRNGLQERGFGDLVARLEWTLAPTERLELGPFAVLSAPTGDEERQLGMGHWMTSAGLLAGWSAAAWRLGARFGYGRALVALDASEHAAHSAGTHPLVDPMNLSEGLAQASVSYRVLDPWQLEAGFYAALPLGVSGTSRAVASLSTRWAWRWLWASLGGQLPLIGSPFSWKVTSALGVAF
jgi:hypothetical protein